jgi:ATP synthase protein I
VVSTLSGLSSRGPEPGGSQRSGGEQEGWAIFSYLIAGMAVYGCIGWLVGRWTHVAVLFPVGMLAGLGLALLLIILRYGRS